ncbi:hypothetical protein M422DRAFT_255158 [Sphaerobolus stellatus SS14]|uniref:Uncharacterized protein n=1 Tax=Sphaerobolus stellatus (strain SS14) TaxID=990650 RepID=A0A0C9VTG6_SPHS4|nr:hypothetical protein M422DRAFT_255158 [Sphaerobolus stellatus SS14]
MYQSAPVTCTAPTKPHSIISAPKRQHQVLSSSRGQQFDGRAQRRISGQLNRVQVEKGRKVWTFKPRNTSNTKGNTRARATSVEPEVEAEHEADPSPQDKQDATPSSRRLRNALSESIKPEHIPLPRLHRSHQRAITVPNQSYDSALHTPPPTAQWIIALLNSFPSDVPYTPNEAPHRT